MSIPSRVERLVDSLRRGARFLRQHGFAAAARRLRADRLPFSPVPDYAYRQWLRAERPGARVVDGTASCVSLLVPLHASKRENVTELYDSVASQSYPNWQLCFSVDGPLSSEVRTLLGEICAKDSRVLVVEAADAPGISAATNAAFRASRGELIGLLDHDDLLPRDALAGAVAAFRDDPELDLLYTDEDILSDRGERPRSPMLKPGPSPILLLGTNYVMHLVVLRRELFDRLGGLRPDFDGAQDHDLLLRAFEVARRLKHLPQLGYHWRAGATSVASGSAAKPWAYERGRRAVEEACRRRKLPIATVTQSAVPGLYELELAPLSRRPSIHIVLHGAGPDCERWRQALSQQSENFVIRSITLGRWPSQVEAGEQVLAIDGRVAPNLAALSELVRWGAAPGIAAVGSSSRGAFRASSTGFSVSASGRAHSIPPLTLHARLPHEVASPGTSLLLLASPERELLHELGGRALTRVDLVCMALGAWVGGQSALSIPIEHLRPRVAEPIDLAELDLSASSLWRRIADDLPTDFWSQGADRFGRRHPLLTPLGMPPPLRSAD